MLGPSLLLKRAVLVVGDYAATMLALAATLLIRYQRLDLMTWDIHVMPFAVLGVFWIIVFYVNGLYDLGLVRDQIRMFRLYLESMFVNLLIGFAFFYILPLGIAPRTNLLLDFSIMLVLGYAWRLSYNRLLAPRLFTNRLVYVGHAKGARRIQELLGKSAAGLELVAVVTPVPDERPTNDDTIHWYTSIADLPSIITREAANSVVLGTQTDEITGLRDALYRTLMSPVALVDQESLEEILTGRVPLEYLSQNWFLENLREGEKAWYESAKRLADVGLALPFGVLTLILYPFVALGIKLSSPGPILYSQMRVGKYGKPFRMYKFRSMRTDAEVNGPQFTADAKTDPRLFAFGRLLRQLRVDEFPQIWNVLRGELSFIGPRPERPEFVDELTRQMPYYPLRHLTRPGLTGWAQVRFLTPTANLEDNLKKLQYDLYYIKHRSALLDAAIMLKTIGIVLKRQGT